MNDESKYVLKRVTTNENIFWGRQMPVVNSLFNCERARKDFGMSLLKTPVQTHHIHADRKAGHWIFDQKFLSAKQHAKEQERIFIPYHQRSKETIAALKWHMAESDFIELLNHGVQYVTYLVPEDATLQQFNKRMMDATSQLSGNQEIVPILSSNHDVFNFKPVMASILGKYKFAGVHFTSPESNANSKSNLLDLWQLNSQIPPDENTSLIIGFNNKKHYSSTKVSGSFVCSKYGIDIPSQMQMHPACVKGMMATKEEEIEFDQDFIYDDIEGGFNKADQQIAWYEENKTLKLLSEISLAERLSKYQAIMWSSFIGQQFDFDKLNQSILDKSGVNNLISEKSRWATYVKGTTTT